MPQLDRWRFLSIEREVSAVTSYADWWLVSAVSAIARLANGAERRSFLKWGDECQ